MRSNFIALTEGAVIGWLARALYEVVRYHAHRRGRKSFG